MDRLLHKSQGRRVGEAAKWDGGHRLLTVDEIMSWGPPYPRSEIEALASGEEPFPAFDIVEAERGDPEVKAWALLREEVLGQAGLHGVTLVFLQALLEQLVEDSGEGEEVKSEAASLAQAIEIKRLWLSGEVPNEVLDAIGTLTAYTADGKPYTHLFVSALALAMHPRIEAEEVSLFYQLVMDLCDLLGERETWARILVALIGAHLFLMGEMAESRCALCDKAECRLRGPSPTAQRGLS